MLRTCSRIIALTAMVALSATAQPADTTLTLACQGTTTFGTGESQPVSMGIIVNFTARTVQGFGSPGDWGSGNFPVKITAWNEVTVVFGGSGKVSNFEDSINGTIDRVTGDVDATWLVTDSKTHQLVSSTGYALKCRPTQRMF